MTAMGLNTLAVTPGSRHRKMRVGCGRSSGKGKTCGRGHKGQMARSGHKHKPAFEGGQMRIIRRIPKRGFNRQKTAYITIALSRLSRFNDGSTVTPESLEKEGMLKNANCPVKILAEGDVTKKLIVKAHAFSESAKTKIVAAGGVCEVILSRPADKPV